MPYAAVEGFVRNQKRMVVRPEIHLHESECFIFRFADKRRIMSLNWFVYSKPLILKPW